MNQFKQYYEAHGRSWTRPDVEVHQTTRASRDKPRAQPKEPYINNQIRQLSDFDKLELARYLIEKTEWEWHVDPRIGKAGDIVWHEADFEPLAGEDAGSYASARNRIDVISNDRDRSYQAVKELKQEYNHMMNEHLNDIDGAIAEIESGRDTNPAGRAGRIKNLTKTREYIHSLRSLEDWEKCCSVEEFFEWLKSSEGRRHPIVKENPEDNVLLEYGTVRQILEGHDKQLSEVDQTLKTLNAKQFKNTKKVRLRDFAKEHTMNKVPYFKVGIFIVQLRGNKPGKDPGTYFPGFRCKTSCKAEAVLKQRDWIDPAMYKLPGGDEWKKEQDRSTRKIVVSKDGNWKNFEHTNKQHHYDVFTEVKNRIHQAAGQKRLSKGHSPQLSFESEPFIVDLADVRQKFTKGDAWMTAPVEYK